MDERILNLDQVIVDNDLNPRQGALDQEIVIDYSAHVDVLPPMHAFDIQGFYYLTGGFHRYAAHQAALRSEGKFIIHQGDRAEAKEWADLDNLKHGLRLSRSERREVIRRQLKRHPDWADVRLASVCGTTDKTVRVIREELEATSEIPRLDVLTGADGIARPRTISRPPAPEPEPGQQPSFESAAPVAPALLTPVEVLEEQQAQQPDYVAVWKLEQGIRSWLFNTRPNDIDGTIEILQAIKDKTPGGLGFLEILLTAKELAIPHRKSDVIQAVNNLLAQQLWLRQESESTNEPGWMGDAGGPGNDAVDLDYSDDAAGEDDGWTNVTGHDGQIYPISAETLTEAEQKRLAAGLASDDDIQQEASDDDDAETTTQTLPGEPEIPVRPPEPAPAPVVPPPPPAPATPALPPPPPPVVREAAWLLSISAPVGMPPLVTILHGALPMASLPADVAGRICTAIQAKVEQEAEAEAPAEWLEIEHEGV